MFKTLAKKYSRKQVDRVVAPYRFIAALLPVLAMGYVVAVAIYLMITFRTIVASM